jgi:hypothetical protein
LKKQTEHNKGIPEDAFISYSGYLF